MIAVEEFSHTHTKVHLHSRQHTQTCTQTQAHISRGCLSLFAVVAFQVFFISSHGEFACFVNSKWAAVTQHLSKVVSVGSSVVTSCTCSWQRCSQWRTNMSYYHCQSPSLVGPLFQTHFTEVDFLNDSHYKCIHNQVQHDFLLFFFLSFFFKKK